MKLRKTAYLSFAYALTVFSAGAQTGVPDPVKRDPASIYIDAVKARMLDDIRQEESLLKDVIALKPDEAAPYHDLARIYLKQRKYDQAEALINKAINLDNKNIWYQATHAVALELQSKTEQAAKVYEQLAAIQRFNPEYIYQAARLYEASGKYREAVALIDKLAEKTGNENLILEQKQQLYLRMNDLDNAVKTARQLIKNNPEKTDYLYNLAELYNSNGQPEKALEIYQNAISQFPDDGKIQYGLALYYKNQKDIARYDEFMERAILNRQLSDEEQATMLFSYLQDAGTDSVRKNKAIAVSHKLAQMYPGNAQIIHLYGEILLNNDQSEEAREQFKKTVILEPSRFTAWQQLLFSYTDQENADSLIYYSAKALRYFPNQASVHYLNGIGHYHKKEYTTAIKSISRAIDLQPEENGGFLAEMYGLLGEIQNVTGNHDASDASYEKSLKLNPNNASVLNNYAYYLSVRGLRLSDAEKMSRKSLEIRPDESTFLDTYGWILFKQGNYSKAKEYIEKAADLNPSSDGTLLDHLGDIHYKLNDKEKAVELWKKAREKGTDNPHIDKKINDRKLYE